VRELQHVIERASILAEGGPILPEHLGLSSHCA
jgi:DNA-binding NtrC family response regulator